MRTLFLVCALFVLHPAFANTLSVNDMVRYCKESQNPDAVALATPSTMLHIGMCYGEISGLRHGNIYLQETNSNKAFCDPDDLTVHEMAGMYVNFVETHYEIMKKLTSWTSLHAAFFSLFPCGVKT
jgi:hypothetical protein